MLRGRTQGSPLPPVNPVGANLVFALPIRFGLLAVATHAPHCFRRGNSSFSPDGWRLARCNHLRRPATAGRRPRAWTARPVLCRPRRGPNRCGRKSRRVHLIPGGFFAAQQRPLMQAALICTVRVNRLVNKMAARKTRNGRASISRERVSWCACRQSHADNANETEQDRAVAVRRVGMKRMRERDWGVLQERWAWV